MGGKGSGVRDEGKRKEESGGSGGQRGAPEVWSLGRS